MMFQHQQPPASFSSLIPLFECCDGGKIDARKQCDKTRDCEDGSDEFYCTNEREYLTNDPFIT